LLALRAERYPCRRGQIVIIGEIGARQRIGSFPLTAPQGQASVVPGCETPNCDPNIVVRILEINSFLHFFLMNSLHSSPLIAAEIGDIQNCPTRCFADTAVIGCRRATVATAIIGNCRPLNQKKSLYVSSIRQSKVKFTKAFLINT